MWVCFPSPDTAASIKELLQSSSPQVSSAVLAFASCFPSPSFPSLFARPLPGPPADGEESAALTNVFIFIWIVRKATRVWETLLNIHTQALTGLLHRALKCASKLGKDKNYLQSSTRTTETHLWATKELYRDLSSGPSCTSEGLQKEGCTKGRGVFTIPALLHVAPPACPMHSPSTHHGMQCPSNIQGSLCPCSVQGLGVGGQSRSLTPAPLLPPGMVLGKLLLTCSAHKPPSPLLQPLCSHALGRYASFPG